MVKITQYTINNEIVITYRKESDSIQIDTIGTENCYEPEFEITKNSWQDIITAVDRLFYENKDSEENNKSEF